jgi:hypothetical protein
MPAEMSNRRRSRERGQRHSGEARIDLSPTPDAGEMPIGLNLCASSAAHDLRRQIGQLQRALRHRTLENAVLKEAIESAKLSRESSSHRRRSR